MVEPFTLVAAQVIFFPDGRQPVERLNEEIRVEMKLKKNIDYKQNDFWPARDEVKSLKLCESDLGDCGHTFRLVVIHLHCITN